VKREKVKGEEQSVKGTATPFTLALHPSPISPFNSPLRTAYTSLLTPHFSLLTAVSVLDRILPEIVLLVPRGTGTVQLLLIIISIVHEEVE
jgi:hypothetical protein